MNENLEAQLYEERNEISRIMKRLKKGDLEQVCSNVGICTSGSKMNIITRLTTIINVSYRFAVDPSSGQSQTHIENLNRMLNAFRTVDMANDSYLLKETSKSPIEGNFQKNLALHNLFQASAAQEEAEKTSKKNEMESCPVLPKYEEVFDLGPNSVILRSFKNPFIEPKEIIVPPFSLASVGNGMYRAQRTFSINNVLINKVSSSGNEPRTGEKEMRVLLRSYQISVPNSNPMKKEEQGHLWPMDTSVVINGRLPAIKQRKLYRQGVQSKLKGDCDALDLFPYITKGNNILEVSCTDSVPFIMLVQLVKNVSVRQMLEEIKNRNRLPKEVALKRVIDSFKISQVEDEDLEATSTKLSLRCPLGLVPIEVPGRGRYCTHLQCFDISMFLSMNENSSGAGWRCSVCNTHIDPNDIIVDQYLNQVIEELGEKISDVEDIEIFSDGLWKPIDESSIAVNKAKSKRNSKKLAEKGKMSQPDFSQRRFVPQIERTQSRGSCSQNGNITVYLVEEDEMASKKCTNGSNVMGNAARGLRSIDLGSDIVDLTEDSDNENAPSNVKVSRKRNPWSFDEPIRNVSAGDMWYANRARTDTNLGMQNDRPNYVKRQRTNFLTSIPTSLNLNPTSFQGTNGGNTWPSSSWGNIGSLTSFESSRAMHEMMGLDSRNFCGDFFFLNENPSRNNGQVQNLSMLPPTSDPLIDFSLNNGYEEAQDPRRQNFEDEG
mmetsp:Transcript_7993/g.12126  ORF Transcript_7993/g.12126 Transcript_7993/m.12126 type:complete len:717 (+) Transcript_7993:149-2299(+)|eukprot:CAMPEP_0171455158 /NCGR_PEP_ID=MMETSP0945-20130129/2165_1 /TAXON_ID=109269 /ORGANISM="Vaucheria litorea, Strain CCMP2940" /LENGTH=716 /DNA_ID=CAMNT_0011980343 /DNA_START=61 /DNA_END=2211 /DNA_ORIENTATION=+